MTQLMLFESPALATIVPPTREPQNRIAKEFQRTEPQSRDASRRRETVSSEAAEPSVSQRSQPTSLPGSLPLYDPAKGELHRMGDLAQLVIRRYEIVAQRRAILLARGPREAARA